MSDVDTLDLENQVSAQTITFQPIQDQLAELNLFHQPENDNNIYHITCRKILRYHLQGPENFTFLNDNYDYEFFIECSDDSATMLHVTCILLSNSLILNILNKKIYGMNCDFINFNCRLTLQQKLSLKQSLKQILPSYFSQYPISVVDSQNMQSHLSTEILESNELRLFYRVPNEDNIYHVTCKMILQYSDNLVSLEDDYDYEFISDDSEMMFQVTCKLLPHSLIVKILNKEFYGINFDVTELKCRYLLTLNQKLNLESNLKQILPSYFLTSNL
jgi:hypothetical protein